ncbi:DMT family transporter [Wielerella bovis]|uniref:DMT family transporter n=1 Tax=Wielerella bovis TaxID=2917790 RepID=UPI0020185E55|nr:DMT family transporter [Wielerella bovis]ULJ62290.1 DMT family transporter [Wielerella bovis]ULJ64513.1 DMT family transporter [Wielerella bovis]ULJ66802.1 DMT family transporter [Wielerella bovis]ULJ69011.1 DMT family transporter [Wielerella bovis]
MDTTSREKLKGFGFMFLSSSLMGGIGAFARYIEAPGMFISFTRSFVGFIGMILIFAVAGKLYKVKQIKFSPTIFLSGIFLGLLSGLYVWSTQLTTLSNAAFLIYTGPIYSTLLATIFLKEPFTKLTAASLVAVFIGCLLIIGIISNGENGIEMSLSLDPKYMKGNLIALGSGVAYGLFLFFSRYRGDVDSDVRSFFNFLFAICTIGIILLFMQPDLSQMTSRGWIVLIIAATVTGFGAFFFLTVASKILLASELATISYQETIMATLLGIALFAEPITGMQMLGGALIILGGVSQIFFAMKKPKQSESLENK